MADLGRAQVEEAYAQEQAKLRQQEGVGGEEEDLHIEAPRLPEINPEIFRDVEPLLFKGFVYAPAVINDVSFVFKSLNHHEFELLGLMESDFGKRVSNKAVQKHFNLFLAFGVLLIDGVNVLPDRDTWIRQIAKMFGDLNEGGRRKVIYHLSEINRRANRAVILSEAFAMEPASRLRWAQFRGVPLGASSVTGFAGTEALGMNWGQLTWRAINYFEDVREAEEREWENAKFVASSMAGKGMSKVHAQDRRRRQTEREDRLQRRDKILRFALLNEPVSKGSVGSANMHVARTVEELTTQLERDLKGEKDWHDMVVEQHERRVRDEYQNQVQAIRERYAAHQAEYGNRGVVGGTDGFQGLSPEEVRFRMERRRQLAAQALAAQQAAPALHDPKTASFLDKWVGVQGTETGSSEVAPLTVDKPKGLPFKRGDASFGPKGGG